MKIKHLALILLILLLIPSCTAFWYKDYQIQRGDLYKPSSVPKLIKALDDKNENVRILAVQTLEYIGPTAKEAIPALIKASENKNVAYYALPALVKIGKDDKALTPHLVRFLEDDNFRNQIAEALEAMGKNAKEASAPLKKIVLTKKDYDQYSAAKALDAIGIDAQEVRITDKDQIEIKLMPKIILILPVREPRVAEYHFTPYCFLPVYFSFKNKTNREILIDPKNINVLDSNNKLLVVSNSKDLSENDKLSSSINSILAPSIVFLPWGISEAAFREECKVVLQEYFNKNVLKKKNLKVNESIEGIVIYRLNDEYKNASLENYLVIIQFKNRNNEDIFSLTSGLYGDVINIGQIQRSFIEYKPVTYPENENKPAVIQEDMDAKINKLRSLLNKGLISQEEFNGIVNKMLEGRDK